MILRRPELNTGEEGSVIVLVAISLLIVLGMVGLAMDVGQMFVAKQQVQAAADAAAQAGIMDMYNGTYSTGTYGTAVTCSGSTINWTPCKYGAMNGLSTDTVKVDFPASAPAWGSACTTSGSGAPNVICVTVQRTIATTFMQALGTSSSTVGATAAAMITLGPATVPIVITHPHLVDALSTGGNSTIVITGGPTRSIQVNSQGDIRPNGTTLSPPEAFSVTGSAYIDLTGGGLTGTGGQFRSWGPGTPASGVSGSGGCTGGQICIGTNGSYVQPASIITDPFATLTQPTAAGLPVISTPPSIAAGVSLGVAGCSAICPLAATGGSCQVFQPGQYPSGIKVKNNTAYFSPGLYFITSADSGGGAKGFTGDSNSDMEMLSSVCTNVISTAPAGFSWTDPTTGVTGDGMLVFNQGAGAFNVGSNGNAILRGTDPGSTSYEGLLFWEDRTLNPGSVRTHSFGGGGAMTLTGTVYVNMLNNVTYNDYQRIQLNGNSGSTTKIIGEIVTNVLALGGGGTVSMTLNSSLVQNVRQVAFVQ